VELEEAKKIEDILKQQLSEKKARCEALEEEVVKTRKEMEKFQALYHQNMSSVKASEELAIILNQQRNPKLKTGLGYEEGSSSDQPSNKDPINFVKSTIYDNKKPVETKEDNQQPWRSNERGTRTKTIDQRKGWIGRISFSFEIIGYKILLYFLYLSLKERYYNPTLHIHKE
jgi:hypothetical protein